MLAGYFRILAMECPACSSGVNRAVSTNSRDPRASVRQRKCERCGHTWYTVEVVVNPVAVGWSRKESGGGCKPMLRVPLEIAVGKDAI